MTQHRDTKNFCFTGTTEIGRVSVRFAILLLAIAVAACEPSDRTPGQWLRGDVADTLPQDWAFTDDFQEVFVEVATPYLIPHSVTIWCAQVDGNLYIGARDPETKNWPGWMNERRDIRLKIGARLYEVRAADVSDEDTLAAVRAAYADKYDLARSAGGEPGNVRYWSIVPRS